MISIMDWIEASLDPNKLTKEEFKKIRNFGTEEELKEALEKIEAIGGYEALA